jgi:hypothetical protein
MERLKHDFIEIPAKDRDHQIARPAIIHSLTQLDRYKSRKTLTPDELTAALRWATYFYKSQRHGCKLMSWEGRISGGNAELADAAVAAGISRDKGISYLGGIDTDFPLIMDHVCAHDHAAESWAIKRGMHPEKGIKTLRKAIWSLFQHYGMRM